MERLPSEAARPLSVSELSNRVKGLLEPAFAEVWVRGEVSNLREQSSGHVYFTLKDSGSQLSAVLFRQDAVRQRVPLRNGMEVVVFGGLSLYLPRGSYQLVARLVIEEGLGALQRRFAALKEKLEAEGLFDPARKRPLPALPTTVAVITSPTGAALRDFVSILQRRGWRGRLRILPARVQGDAAASELVAQLERANRDRLGELIVLTRGGGSLEDLWPFNEEIVARAVAASELPVISAVGHEIDFALSDFAADRRAETPSAAAELISSPFVAFLESVRRARNDLDRCTRQRLQHEEHRTRILRGALRAHSPQARLEQAWLRLDDLRGRHSGVLVERLHRAHRSIGLLTGRLWRRDPAHRLAAARGKLQQLEKRLVSASPASALARGYAIVRDEKGRVVARRAGLPRSGQIALEFADGRADFSRRVQTGGDQERGESAGVSGGGRKAAADADRRGARKTARPQAPPARRRTSGHPSSAVQEELPLDD